MRNATWSVIVPAIVMLAVGIPGQSYAQVLDPIQYHLASGSNLEYGCFGPCACPVVFSGPLKGDFTFYRPGTDPQSRHYELLNINWSYSMGDSVPPRHVTGHGTYDLAGTDTLTQRMTLELTTNDTLPQHFDSGWVPARPIFPAIDVKAHLRIDACFDSIFHVIASPSGSVASVDPSSAVRMIRMAAPNPSSTSIEVVLALSTAGHARADVLDLHGRLVARLLDRDLAAGEQRLRWNGRDAHGQDAGAGVFWIRAQAGAQIDRRRIVRLR
jgi:hypothetical protein